MGYNRNVPQTVEDVHSHCFLEGSDIKINVGAYQEKQPTWDECSCSSAY